MSAAVNTFLIVLAAIFPVVNPPGTALVFLALTSGATAETRRILARRVAVNSLFILMGSFVLGSLVLRFYGISIPILRVAGGLVVAVSGWKLLNEGSQDNMQASADVPRTDPMSQAFYPLTLPLTTGPGSIAVTISIGLSRETFTGTSGELFFVAAGLLAILVIAFSIWFCLAYAARVQKLLGKGGTEIAVRLSAFILFCLGVQILWSGLSELLTATFAAR